MKTTFYTILFSFVALLIRAQTVTPIVVSNNGGFSSSPVGSIAWTIGEPVSESFTTAANITTMGFNQPELAVASFLKEREGFKNVVLYPNPVSDLLKINMSDLPEGTYHFKVMDSNGKLMLEKTIFASATNQSDDLNFKNYANGIYFLQVTNNQLNKTFKLTKINQ